MLDGDFVRRHTGERCLWSVFRCGVLPAQERPAGRISGRREVWNRQHGTTASATHADKDLFDTNPQVMVLIWMVAGHAKNSMELSGSFKS